MKKENYFVYFNSIFYDIYIYKIDKGCFHVTTGICSNTIYKRNVSPRSIISSPDHIVETSFYLGEYILFRLLIYSTVRMD